jgi:hypothetical protein
LPFTVTLEIYTFISASYEAAGGILKSSTMVQNGGTNTGKNTDIGNVSQLSVKSGVTRSKGADRKSQSELKITSPDQRHSSKYKNSIQSE